MKKQFGVLSTILFSCAALVGCQQPSGNAVAASADSIASTMQIAYINTDSLLLNYEFSKKKSEELMGKEESSRAEYNQKARVFQQDAVEFQRKVQNNGFLSMERAQSEQNRLAKMEQDLAELNNKLSNELMQEQNRINAELRDTITRFLADYAKDKYTLILSNTMGDNVLYAAPGVDITADVVKELNARYNAKKK